MQTPMQSKMNITLAGGRDTSTEVHKDKTNCLCCIYPSPIRVGNLMKWLPYYPNRKAARVLEEGFKFGFKLAYGGSRVGRDSDNLKSATEDPQMVIQKLDKEINLGRIAGPFKDRPINNLIVSPVGLVPKAEPGKFRLIHHLSYPHGGSINDGIDREVCAVQYTSFDEAVNLVIQMGKGALMAKADIESAFRLLPINPGDFQLLGIKVLDKFYVDKALPMGASCSPAHFELFSTFIEWVVRREAGSNAIIHYMDDFCLVGGPGEGGGRGPSCADLVNCLGNVCKELGVPLAPDKSVGPTTKLVFLGLEIDSVKQLISVPPAKLSAIVEKVKAAAIAKFLTLKKLQSLIGSLSFICRAIPPGRAFLRRLIDLTMGERRPWRKITLSKGAKSDLSMWLVFLRDFNGRAIFPDQYWMEDKDMQLFTDASGSVGFGGFFRGKWFNGRWPSGLSGGRKNIAWKEFFPILVAVVLWGESLSGRRIIIRSDNESVVAIINKQSSRCPEVMKLLRFFILQCLKLNILFAARHIAGKDNDIADALSRFQVHRFRELAPGAEERGLEVPAFLWRL